MPSVKSILGGFKIRVIRPTPDSGAIGLLVSKKGVCEAYLPGITDDAMPLKCGSVIRRIPGPLFQHYLVQRN